jgi:phosphatidylglycerophosphatase C
MNIAIYDLDKTITRRATFTRFLIYFARRTTPLRLVGLPIWICALLGYRLGLYPRKPLKQFGIALFMGRYICTDRLAQISARFADNVVERGLQPGAVARIQRDQENNALLVLATAAPEFYARIIATKLGVKVVIATCHATTADGKTLHRIHGENCYAEEKLRRIQCWLVDQGIDRKGARITFYSDDISDSPTLDFADDAFAVNPSKNFADAAAKAGWGILNFREAEGITNAP